MFAALRASFAFLTVLIPGRIFSNTCMKNSTFFYPIVGIVLGLILSCFSILTLHLSASPALASIAYLTLYFFLTRGLHHDGLADVADAWGSGARGTQFRTILKDSRIGSFGSIVLILYFLLCYTSLTHILSLNLSQEQVNSPIQYFVSTLFKSNFDMILLLFFAPIWGRIGLLVQPAFDMPYIPSNSASKLNTFPTPSTKKTLLNDSPIINKMTQIKTPKNNQLNENDNAVDIDSNFNIPSSLSQNMVHRFQKTRFFLWLIIFSTLFLITSSLSRLVFTLGASLLVFLAFFLLSKREQGYNGDFLGAQCLCFEAIFFLNIYV